MPAGKRSRLLFVAIVGTVTVIGGLLVSADSATATADGSPSIQIIAPRCVGVGQPITLHTYAAVGDQSTHLSFGDIYFDQDSPLVTSYSAGAQYAEQDVTVEGRSSGSYEIEATVTDSNANRSYEEQAFVNVVQGCDTGTIEPLGAVPPSSPARVAVSSKHVLAGASYRLDANVYDAAAVGSGAGTLTWQQKLSGTSVWRAAGITAVQAGPFTATSPSFVSNTRTYYRAVYTPDPSCECQASAYSGAATVSVAPRITKSISIAATRTYVTATLTPRAAGTTLRLQLATDSGWQTQATARTNAKGAARLSLSRPSRGGVFRVVSAVTAAYLAGSTSHFMLKARRPLTQVEWDCEHPRYKPTTVETCGSGTVYFTNIKYMTYTDSLATGTLTAHINNCNPDCATGHFYKYRGTFRFYSIRNRQDVPNFTMASIRISKGNHFTIRLGLDDA